MSLCLTPKAGMIFVRPTLPKPFTAGPIELADVYHEVPTSGEIVALAPAFVCSECGGNRETDLREGDLVLWNPSAGSEFDWQGETLLALREADVLGILWFEEGQLAS